MNIEEILSNQLVILKQLDEILEQEKEVLISNEGQRLIEIVEKKTELVETLETIEKHRVEIYGHTKIDEIKTPLNTKGHVLLLGKELKTIHQSIKEKQEINFILTKQSIAYQNTLFEIIQNQMKRSGNVYGRDGKIDQQTQLNTSINKSV